LNLTSPIWSPWIPENKNEMLNKFKSPKTQPILYFAFTYKARCSYFRDKLYEDSNLKKRRKGRNVNFWNIFYFIALLFSQDESDRHWLLFRRDEITDPREKLPIKDKEFFNNYVTIIYCSVCVYRWVAGALFFLGSPNLCLVLRFLSPNCTILNDIQII